MHVRVILANGVAEVKYRRRATELALSSGQGAVVNTVKLTLFLFRCAYVRLCVCVCARARVCVCVCVFVCVHIFELPFALCSFAVN